MFRKKTKEKNYLRKKATQRSSVTLTISLIVIAIILMLSYCSPITKAGTVEYKLVTGTKDNTLHFIILNTGGEIVSVDKDYENFISAEDRNLVIDKSLEAEIKAHYSDIKYRVSIRKSEKDEIATYLVSRDVFNKLNVGATVNFEIEGSQRDAIKRLIDERYNAMMKEKINDPRAVLRHNYE